MDPAEYRLPGTLAHVSMGIPAGGSGEIVFSKAGARRSEAARLADGQPIPRGTQVVITDFERGFAIVQRANEPLAPQECAAGSS